MAGSAPSFAPFFGFDSQPTPPPPQFTNLAQFGTMLHTCALLRMFLTRFGGSTPWTPGSKPRTSSTNIYTTQIQEKAAQPQSRPTTVRSTQERSKSYADPDSEIALTIGNSNRPSQKTQTLLVSKAAETGFTNIEEITILTIMIDGPRHRPYEVGNCLLQ